MRIFIVDTCYPAFLTSHYARNPGLGRRSYDEQWRALMDTFFGTADSYSHFLGQLGHEAREFVVNCEPLQRAWEREHQGRRLLRRRRAYDSLVVRQAAAFQPDVVYVQDLGALAPDTLSRLRAQARLLAGQIASEPPAAEVLREFDLVVTSLPHFVEMFQAQGIESEYLPLAFDPRVLDRLDSGRGDAEVVFVGGLSRRQHGRGNSMLEQAARRVPIDVWGYGVDDWPDDSPFRARYHGEAWGVEMFRILGGARIALNRHIDIARDYANNMRLYEGTGVGTFVLTDAGQNLNELFDPGSEVETYANVDDLVEKVRHYLDNDAEREAIAAAGQRRTLGSHSYDHRMRELVEILTRRTG
jgi:hypothetical protein